MRQTLRPAASLIALLSLLLPALMPPAASAQNDTGTIRGRILLSPTTLRTGGQQPLNKSESRTPLAHVPVKIIDLESKVERVYWTDEDGVFESVPLPARLYKIVVAGFDLLREVVPVNILRTNEVVIEVSGTARTYGRETIVTPSVDNPTPIRILTASRNLTDARRDATYVAKTANEVSLGGSSLTRSFDELAFYMPGIASPPQTLSSFAGPGFGPGIGTAGQFSANGLRSRANNFTVDGSDNNDEDIGVRRQGFLSLVPQAVESLHEYQVITAAAPAHVGRNLGAQVNAVSQYGTRNLHGSFYGTLSSQVLNAADFFDTTGGDTTIPLTALVDGSPRAVHVNGLPHFVTNGAGRKDRFAFAQLGSTLSGPLRASGREEDFQLFAFGSYEFQRLRATKETHFAVPTVEQRGLLGTGATGLARDPFTGAALDAFPTSAQGDAVFSLFPFPNNPGGPYGRNTFTQELPADGLGHIGSLRLDGSKQVGGRLHQFTGRFNLTDDYRDVPTVAGALFSTIRPNVRAQNVSLFVNSDLNRARTSQGDEGRTVTSARVSNQLFVSYGRTGFDFEERRDTGFLSPTGLRLDDPDDRRFLLNLPVLENRTRPGSSVIEYVRNPNVSVEARLGTPFELVPAPIGQVAIAGYSPAGLDVFTFPQTRTNNTYQLADTLTVQTGDHALAFGADLRRSELNSRLPRNSRALILFTGVGMFVPSTGVQIGRLPALDAAAAGAANVVSQTLAAGDDSTIGLRYYQYNFFGRDEWRVRPNLSLSFGLRYEYNTPPREAHRRIERTFDSPVLASVGLVPFIGGRTRIFAPDRNNFAPRLGLAYSFGSSDDKPNVIRVGAGVYYDQAPGVVVSQSRSVVPTFVTYNTAGFFEAKEDGTPFGLGILIPSTFGISCDGSGRIAVNLPGTLNTIDPRAPVTCLLGEHLINRQERFGFEPILQTALPAADLKMPMAYHYTASYEREFGGGAVVSVSYVGTQARHLLMQTTPNLGDHSPVGVHSVYIRDDRPRFGGQMVVPQQRDADGVLRSRPSRLAGTVRLYESSGNSRYDSLQVQATRKLLHGMSFQFNYTLSKVTDDVSDVFELAGAPALPQNSFTRAGERAYANFDARHIFTGFVNYDFGDGGGVGEPSLGKFLFGGWQVTGKMRYQTGQPFTVNTVRDVNRDGNLTDRLDTTEGLVVTGDRQQPLILTVDPNSLLAPVSEDGAVGRNTFRAGSRFELDLSFLKNFYYSKPGLYQRQLTFRFDAFNLTNRANFGVPVRLLEAPGFGGAVSTVTPARRLQFSLKYSF
ncbi:MAG TPA: hypothetical protein VF297_01680 [Pyrinomonadaceae bacterium]